MPENFSHNNENDIQENKETAASSYFLVFAPILYITRKDSAFIQFHSAQGGILFLAFLFFWILGSFFSPLKWLNLVVFFGSLLGFLQAIKGVYYPIPFVSEILKEGISPKKIFQGIMRAGKIFGKIILGFFPKKTGDKIAKKLRIDPDAELLQRIENIEKILLQEKFFHSQGSIALANFDENWKKIFSEILQEIKKHDLNVKVLQEKTFYECTGTFGTILFGGRKEYDEEHFLYAVSRENSLLIKTPQRIQDEILFGGFLVGKWKKNTPFIS